MLIASIPSPDEIFFENILKCSSVDGIRYNTGVSSPYTPKEILQKLLEARDPDDIYVDLKGRQPRIIRWARADYGRIVVNRRIISNDKNPLYVVLRDDGKYLITQIVGRKIFLDPRPDYVGEGESFNIEGNFTIEGCYLTQKDRDFISAANELGIKNFLLSFFEETEDINSVLKLAPNANLCLKIESPKGVDFIKNNKIVDSKIHLMVAQDDLWINVGQNNLHHYFDILKMIIKIDPEAVLASKLFTSFSRGQLEMTDCSSFLYVKSLGFKHFMLSDGSKRYFNEAIKAFWNLS